MTGFALNDIQKWMQAALVSPETTSRSEASTRLTTSARLSPAEGLAIYQRSYALRIAACMREQFPALCHALGAELFNDFVAEYIRAAPPASYTLYDLGRRFPAFLQSNRPDALGDTVEPWFDFMVDLAVFERLVFTVFDCDGVEDAILATVDTPLENLRIQPSLRIGQYRYPVAWYYHQIRDEADPQIPNAEHSSVAILRKDFQTTTFPIAPAHAIFLQSMCDGASIDQSLDTVANALNIDPKQVKTSWDETPEVLLGWIKMGVFVDRP